MIWALKGVKDLHLEGPLRELINGDQQHEERFISFEVNQRSSYSALNQSHLGSLRHDRSCSR